MIGISLAYLPLPLFVHWLAVGISFVAMIALESISSPVFGLLSQELVVPQWRTTMASTSRRK